MRTQRNESVCGREQGKQMSEHGSTAERAHKQVVVSCICMCVLQYVWSVFWSCLAAAFVCKAHTETFTGRSLCSLSLSLSFFVWCSESANQLMCASVRMPATTATLSSQQHEKKLTAATKTTTSDIFGAALLSFATICVCVRVSVCVCVCVRWQSLSQAAVRVLLLRQYRNFLWHVWLHALAVVRSRRYRRRRGRRVAYVSCVWLCLEARRQHQSPQAAQFQHCGIKNNKSVVNINEKCINKNEIVCIK